MMATLEQERPPSRVRSLWRRLEGPGTPGAGAGYYLILGSTLALTAIGIMMVLSASSVESIARGESPYTAALKQAVFGVVGVVGMLVISRIKVRWLKRLAWPGIGATLVLLVLVQLIGKRVLGNRNWIDVAGFSLQPSEFAKLILALWMATILDRKAPLLGNWLHAMLPVLPVGLGVAGLVIAGHDLGTTLVILLVTAAGLFFGGVPARLFLASVALMTAGATASAITSPNRMCRIYSWLGQSPAECTQGADFGYQAQNGLRAFASGGWLGVGLGQSRQKYNWIPEAQNDFIFSVLGEELGLFGTILVLALFVVLAVAIFRVAVRQQELFPRVLTGTIMAWLIGQAVLNMGMVTGLLPVVGVPLPFISSGGSALVSCLCAVGVVLSLAREGIRPAGDTGWPAKRAARREPCQPSNPAPMPESSKPRQTGEALESRGRDTLGRRSEAHAVCPTKRISTSS